MKYLFVRSKRYSDFFVFANAGLREQRSQPGNKTFQKKFFALKVLCMYLPYIK